MDFIWEYGVLKKGFGLCHGISGNGYAFISPSIQQALPDRKAEYLNKANLFALLRYEKEVMKEIKTFHFSDRYVVGKSDNPFSLMLGVAGDICFTLDAMEGVGKFPGFDFWTTKSIVRIKLNFAIIFISSTSWEFWNFIYSISSTIYGGTIIFSIFSPLSHSPPENISPRKCWRSIYNLCQLSVSHWRKNWK